MPSQTASLPSVKSPSVLGTTHAEELHEGRARSGLWPPRARFGAGKLPGSEPPQQKAAKEPEATYSRSLRLFLTRCQRAGGHPAAVQRNRPLPTPDRHRNEE